MNYFKKLLIFICLVFMSIHGFSQSIKVVIYRPNRWAGKPYGIDVTCNDTYIAKLPNKSAVTCYFQNEGLLKIGIKQWYLVEDYQLTIKKGKTYYIEVPQIAIKSESIAIEEINTFSEKRRFTFKDDINNPVVEKVESNYAEKSKIDTVKQIIYINKEQTNYQYEAASDIDNNIPIISQSNEMQFAFIIGNEDYSSLQKDLKSEMNVDFARNDASAVREYFIKTLGIPEKNITFILDGTFGQIIQGISKFNLIVKNTNGKARIYFYYAGHGLPDEQTKEPYLMPVDVSGSNLNSAIKLKDVYSKLSEFPCERITVILDACFTGGGRNQGLFAARGVKIKPKEELLEGNIVVFSSSSGDQSSLPYKEKQHGMFTYFFLKKLQESKAEITYKELSDYLKEKVALESVLINSKEQNPQVNVNPDIFNIWGNWKF